MLYPPVIKSSNWKYPMYSWCSMILPLKRTFMCDFQLPCLMIPKGISEYIPLNVVISLSWLIYPHYIPIITPINHHFWWVISHVFHLSMFSLFFSGTGELASSLRSSTARRWARFPRAFWMDFGYKICWLTSQSKSCICNFMYMYIIVYVYNCICI